GPNALCLLLDEGTGLLHRPASNPDKVPLLPPAECYDPNNFNDRVVLIAITNYGVRGVQDARFQSHFSLLKTIEAAFGLPFLGHAADPTTNTLAPLLAP